MWMIGFNRLKLIFKLIRYSIILSSLSMTFCSFTQAPYTFFTVPMPFVIAV